MWLQISYYSPIRKSSFIQVYFVDTLKFFLSLYGHSLPVLCLDVSYDGELIVTGSVDKSVKVWGLNFGDCHKSLLAHDGRQVNFVAEDCT